MKASDKQIAGGHYASLPIQPSEFIHRNGLGWCEGNAIKYVCRHGSKNGRQDIEKAIHYLQLLLKWEYPDAPRGSSVAAPAPDVGAADVCGLYRDRPGACPSCEEDE
jgi:hypothetical protein